MVVMPELVPIIHVLLIDCGERRGARDKPGHDEFRDKVTASYRLTP
jgi:hypothetical protein